MFSKLNTITTILFTAVLINASTAVHAQQQQQTAAQTAPFSYVIDSTIAPREAIEARTGQPAPRIGTVFDPKGIRQDFVVDEIIIHPRSNSELRQFLRTYNATVVDDGKLPALPPAVRPRGGDASRTENAGFVVVKVDLTRAPLSRMANNARRLKLTGRFRYSSEESARLTAIIMEERVRGRRLGIDLIFEPQSARLPCPAKTTLEHPINPAAPVPNAPNLGFRNAVDFRWLNDRDIRVIDAWDRLERAGHAKKKVLLFVIDGGFAPNADYRTTAYQYDFVNDAYNSVGQNPGNCGHPCPWHATMVFSVAGAVINNRFGAAGTGGQVVEPVLFRTRYKFSEGTRAVRSAIIWARQLRLPAVINMSWGGSCGFFCWAQGFDNAVEEAANAGVIPIASAGNKNEDVEDDNFIPCKETGVICVGAIGLDKRRASFSSYGSRVDIWAPGVGLATTPNPATGDAPGVALPSFDGTSAATPFVAGIVAMMKAINPTITRNQVRNILRSEATSSADPRVSPGYVNAFNTIHRTLTGTSPNLATRFISGAKWHDSFGRGNEFVSVGDFNGDCRDDIVTFTKGTSGEVFVALSSGTDFIGTGWRWGLNTCVKDQICVIGDFNNDRKDDIAAIDQDTGKVHVALSLGTSFMPTTEWAGSFSRRRGQTVRVGNFGHTGADDLAVFVHGNNPNTLGPGEARGEVFVALSDDRSFMARNRWHHFFAPGSESVASGDFNADGFNDIVAFLQSCCPAPAEGDVFVAPSGLIAFGASANWHNFFSPGTEVPGVGDFNGDGRFDVVSFVRSSSTGTPGIVKVGLAGPSSRIELVGVWHRSFCFGAEVCLTGDFNGDRRTDVIAFTRGDPADVWVALAGL
jgi:hypothetical protein